jgi:hypothetical protein
MRKTIRELFEEFTVPSFGPFDGGIVYNERGEYLNSAIEDHWQTFQEGFEIALQECINNLEFHGHAEAISQLEWLRGKLGIKQ